MTYKRNKRYALGGALSGGLSMASTGASLGSTLFPGVGTFVGAGLGALVGGITGSNAEDERAKEIEKEKLRVESKKKLQSDIARLSGYNTRGVSDYSFFAKGGVIDLIPGVDYEVEGDEVVQGLDTNLEKGKALSSDLTKAEGPSHEQGGVGGQGGERVFSDRIKAPEFIQELLSSQGIKGIKGKTYAEVSENLGKKKGKMEKKMVSKFESSVRTAGKMIDRIDGALDLLFSFQEEQKDREEAPKQKFATGGLIPYKRINPVIDPRAVSTPDVPILDSSVLSMSPKLPTISNPTIPTTLKADNPFTASDNTVLKGTSGWNKAGDFITNNLGQIANLGNFIGNLSDVNSIDTSVERTLVDGPVYNYRDRSESQQREIGRAVRGAINSLGTSSRTVNASNIGALVARGLDASNRVALSEAERRDNYDNIFRDRQLQVDQINAGITNQASDLRRDLNNQKTAARQQARTAFTQGVIANNDNQRRFNNDSNRMALGYLINNENGVFDRDAKAMGLTTAEYLRRLKYGRSLLGR